MASVLHAVGNGRCERTAGLSLFPSPILTNGFCAIPKSPVSHALRSVRAKVKFQLSVRQPRPFDSRFAEAGFEWVGWTPSPRSVSLRDFGTDFGRNGAEGLGCFVFGGHVFSWFEVRSPLTRRI